MYRIRVATHLSPARRRPGHGSRRLADQDAVHGTAAAARVGPHPGTGGPLGAVIAFANLAPQADGATWGRTGRGRRRTPGGARDATRSRAHRRRASLTRRRRAVCGCGLCLCLLVCGVPGGRSRGGVLSHGLRSSALVGGESGAPSPGGVRARPVSVPVGGRRARNAGARPCAWRRPCPMADNEPGTAWRRRRRVTRRRGFRPPPCPLACSLVSAQVAAGRPGRSESSGNGRGGADGLGGARPAYAAFGHSPQHRGRCVLPPRHSPRRLIGVSLVRARRGAAGKCVVGRRARSGVQSCRHRQPW